MEIYGIPIQIEIDDGEVVVSDDIVNQYGAGATQDEAIEDYKLSVIEYYLELESDGKSMLGKHLAEHLAYLKGKLN